MVISGKNSRFIRVKDLSDAGLLNEKAEQCNKGGTAELSSFIWCYAIERTFFILELKEYSNERVRKDLQSICH